MNTSKLLSAAILAAAALASTGAFANDSDYPTAQVDAPVSTTTRAQVRAEYLQAKREGTLIESDINYPVVAAERSTKSRAEVKAELREAQRAGHSMHIDNSYPDSALDSAS